MIGPESDFTAALVAKHGTRPLEGKVDSGKMIDITIPLKVTKENPLGGERVISAKGMFNLLREYTETYPDDSLGWGY